MEMMIEDLKQLRESEDHIEFKEAKRNYPFAGGKHVDPKERRRCVLGYIVALANEKGGRWYWVWRIKCLIRLSARILPKTKWENSRMKFTKGWE